MKTFQASCVKYIFKLFHMIFRKNITETFRYEAWNRKDRKICLGNLSNFKEKMKEASKIPAPLSRCGLEVNFWSILGQAKDNWMTISKFRPGSSSWFRPCSTQYWVGRIFDTFRRRDLSHLKMTMADKRWKKSRLVFDEVFSNESGMFAELSVKLVRLLFVQEARVLFWCRTMPTRASTCTTD